MNEKTPETLENTEKPSQNTEKTLNDLINGRITDKVYVPKDPSAVYHLSDMLDPRHDLVVNVDKLNEREDAIEALRKRIKATSDCIELRSLKPKEYEKMLADVPKPEEGVEIPFKDGLVFKRFYASLVSVKPPDGSTVYKWEKDIDYWAGYLTEISDDHASSLMRIFEKLDNMAMTSKREQSVMESIDFLS
jgi:hypothetical protein